MTSEAAFEYGQVALHSWNQFRYVLFDVAPCRPAPLTGVNRLRMLIGNGSGYDCCPGRRLQSTRAEFAYPVWSVRQR